MIAWLGAIFLMVGFLALLKLFRLVPLSQQVIRVLRDSLMTMGSVDISEIDKERIIQRNGLRLLGYFLVLALGGAAALLLPFGLLWAADKLQLLDLPAILQTTVSPVFLIVTSVLSVALLYYWSVRAKREDRDSSKATSYSGIERLIHDIAFGTFPLQFALCRVENRFFRKTLARYQATRPVFITGLPRAGSTLLLECCHASREFATHTYRDMPFVPMLCTWGSFTRFFGKKLEKRERAHGDGMLIDSDSPEALEEILWIHHWHEQYRPDRLLPWPSEAPSESFRDVHTTHMRKVIHRRKGETDTRYVAKNNQNIARVELLRSMYPDAVLLVPFRDPLQHAASLRRQHCNFLAIHSEDTFSADYMRAIGHFDFGANLRPIDFDDWLAGHCCQDRESLGFWLEYWTAAYRNLLAQECHLCFFSYEHFCDAGENGLRDLANALDARLPEDLLLQHTRLKPAQRSDVNSDDVPEAVLNSARQVHAELLSRAVNTK